MHKEKLKLNQMRVCVFLTIEMPLKKDTSCIHD